MMPTLPSTAHANQDEGHGTVSRRKGKDTDNGAASEAPSNKTKLDPDQQPAQAGKGC